MLCNVVYKIFVAKVLANRLKDVYKDKIELFVGFEGEWIRESSLSIIDGLLRKYELDLFVGTCQIELRTEY